MFCNSQFSDLIQDDQLVTDSLEPNRPKNVSFLQFLSSKPLGSPSNLDPHCENTAFYFYQHQVKPDVNRPLKKKKQTKGTSVFLHTHINSFPLQVKMFTNVSHLGTTSCSLNLLMDFKPHCQTTQLLTAETRTSRDQRRARCWNMKTENAGERARISGR